MQYNFQYNFGALKSPPDPRDYIYSQMIPTTALPTRFLLDEYPVRNQGIFGTCVGMAASGIKDWQESKNYRRTMEMSPLFVYSRCKEQDGIPDKEGTYPRTAMAVLKNEGICTEKTMPYKQMINKLKPPQATDNALKEAKEFVVGAYARVQTLDEIKQAIYRDGPVMGALLVTDSFMEPEPGGFVPMPRGYLLGNHAEVITGWDDNLQHTYKTPYMGQTTFKGFIRVRNSWGVERGDNGYEWVPYAYLAGSLDVGVPYWQESWSSVDVVLPVPGAKQIIITPGKDYALVDGGMVKLDQPAFATTDTQRIMMPLRFIAEQMGWNVHWDGTKVIMSKI